MVIDTTFFIGDNRLLCLRTTDGGLTWGEQDPGLPRETSQTQGKLLAVQQIDSLNVVAVGDSGVIVRTFDGGASWEKQDAHTPYVIRHVHFSDPLSGMLTTGGPQHIRITSDGGRTWQIPTSTGPLLADCHSFGAGRFLAQEQGSNRIFTTKDSWATTDSITGVAGPCTDSLCTLLGPLFYEGADTIIATGSRWTVPKKNDLNSTNFIFISTDRGATWDTARIVGDSPVADSLPAFITDMTSIGGATALAVGTGRQILRTTDHGKSWRSEPMATELPAFQAVGIGQTTDGSFIAAYLPATIVGYQGFILRGEPQPRSVAAQKPAASDIQLYPNPTADKLTVTSGTSRGTVLLVDVMGRQRLRGTIPSDGALQFEVSALPRGIYGIMLERDGDMAFVGKVALVTK